MAKPLVTIDDEIAYITIDKNMNSESTFEEVGEGKFEYKRKGEMKFDELVVIRPDNTKITYILDSRSELMYEKLPERVLGLKGSVYERQPAKE